MSTTIRLSPSDSRRLLDAAVQSRSPIIVQSSRFPGVTINGSLISADEQALLMEVTGNPAVSFDTIDGTDVDVQVYSERRLAFSSTITAAPAWGKSRAISIQRPQHVHVTERRKFLRAKLAPSSRLTLEWQAGGQLHRHAATLLNISPEGIACRLEQSAADAIERRATLTAIFELPSCDQPFHLRALVSNKTPASEGCSIIGLQFLRSEREIRELAALRRALEHDQNAEATARA